MSIFAESAEERSKKQNNTRRNCEDETTAPSIHVPVFAA
jgi:hypothetical protein